MGGEGGKLIKKEKRVNMLLTIFEHERERMGHKIDLRIQRHKHTREKYPLPKAVGRDHFYFLLSFRFVMKITHVIK